MRADKAVAKSEAKRTPWPDGWWRSVREHGTRLWRGVEAQHLIATMKLVDDAAEQLVLEDILEASKPPLPLNAVDQHYLIATPFRYPSPQASRFRGAGATGAWYGAERVETACTELAYWRWRFLMDSEGLREQELVCEFTLFRACVQGRMLDLTEPPWSALSELWKSDDYTGCHALAAEARRHAAQWIRYASARHVEGRCAVVFDPTSLSDVDLKAQQTWACKVTSSAAFMRHGAHVISLAF